jgi:hypothetical protein
MRREEINLSERMARRASGLEDKGSRSVRVNNGRPRQIADLQKWLMKPSRPPRHLSNVAREVGPRRVFFADGAGGEPGAPFARASNALARPWR